MAAVKPVGKLYVTVESASVTDKESEQWTKALSASLKVEVRDGSNVQKAKTKQVPRVKTSDGFFITYEEVLTFDIAPGFPGELRLQLCRVKNNGLTGGTVPIANAGIFIKNIIAYIEKSKSGLHKRFTLFTKETGSPSGVVTLALTYAPIGAKPPPIPAKLQEATHAAARAEAGGPRGAAAAPADDDVEDHRLADVKSGGGGPPMGLLVLGLAAVAGVVGAVVMSQGGAGQGQKKAPAAAKKAGK